MKRDMELVLKILAHLEERQEVGVIQRLKIPGYRNVYVYGSRSQTRAAVV